MKVLFYGDVPHRLAGAQKSLLLSLSRIADFGVEPIVAFPFEGIFQRACRDEGLDVRVLPSPPSMQSFGGALFRMSARDRIRVVVREMLPFARQLARLAEREDVGAIHFNTPRGITTAGPAATMARLGAVMHLRGVPIIGRGYWFTIQTLADRFVLVARALLPYFAKSVQPRCRVVYNGVPLPDPIPRHAARGALREQLSSKGISLPDSALVFVSLSSPTPFKGLHHLLEAAVRAKARGMDAIFLCAGVGNADRYESWLGERIVEEKMSDRFHLLGFFKDVHTLLCSSDAMVLPSVHDEELVIDGQSSRVRGSEGLPRAILESFAAGVPVVATRVAGVEEQVDHGRTGLVVEPGDDAMLTDALLEVARRPEWRIEAGRAGREVVASRFSVPAAARGLAEVLRELAANPPSIAARARSLAALGVDTFGRGR